MTDETYKMLIEMLKYECDKYNKKTKDKKKYQHEYYLKVTKHKRKQLRSDLIGERRNRK